MLEHILQYANLAAIPPGICHQTLKRQKKLVFSKKGWEWTTQKIDFLLPLFFKGWAYEFFHYFHVSNIDVHFCL